MAMAWPEWTGWAALLVGGITPSGLRRSLHYCLEFHFLSFTPGGVTEKRRKESLTRRIGGAVDVR